MLIHLPPHTSILAMDVHKNTISAAVLAPGSDVPLIERISSDVDAVRHLLGRFEDRRSLVACYEAGPTGYELARYLTGAGVRCEVIAPSLIPVAQGQRVKTDSRDARRLALLLRGGQLSSIRVPTVAEEGVRDLCRARGDMVIDRTRARHRLDKFLLRHGRIYRGGENWTLKHAAWVAGQRFEDEAVRATFGHYRATLEARDAALRSIEGTLDEWLFREPFADSVHRLGAYRGITHLGALSLAAEVCDWRRFPTAAMFMGFTGLVPSESSSGERTSRGGITHAGNGHLRTQLVEAAWSYKAAARVGPVLAKRHQGLDPAVLARAWAAQLRLCAKFRRLDARKTNRKIVATAIARELAGFVWAEMTAP